MSHHAPPGAGCSTFTSYVVISGPGTMFPGGRNRSGSTQVTDGPAETLMVVEAANVQIPWTKPEPCRRAAMAPRSTIAITRAFRAITQAEPLPHSATADCRFLPGSINGMVLRSLVTIAGGETIPPNW